MKKKSILHKATARSRNSFLLPEILSLTGNELPNKKWIFIVGCYNSGTTLLNQILGSHPSISVLPDEGVMLTNKLVKPEDLGWRRMWWKCRSEMSAAQDLDIHTAKKIKKQWSHFYQDKPYLLEKSISNTCRIPFFQNHFQPAYFIHLVRNGYAVAEGIKRKAEIIKGNPYYEGGNYPIDLCISQWTESLKEVEENKRNLKNFIEIKYEDLTSNPELVINRLTQFLSLTPLPKTVLDQSFSVHEKSSEITNMNKRSLERLTPQEIKIINLRAEKMLQKYNYQVL